MFKKMLVPVDGSAFAEVAVRLALGLAEREGAQVRLAMVNEPTNLPPGLWAEAFLANHARYVETTLEAVRDRAAPGVSVTGTLLEGEVAPALCHEAVVSGSDAIVMSTHGHGGLSRLWLGSVTDEVIRLSPVPVLAVRPTERPDGTVTAPEHVTRIAVPLDGTPFAEAAIAPAVDLAARYDAELTVLRTVAYPVLISSYLPDTADENREMVERAEEEARDYLDLVRSRFAGDSTEMHLEVIVSPRPARGVLDFVAEHGVDLVVMASHGRHGLTRAVIGSVADKVIRGAHVPVLVLHPEPRRAQIPKEEVA